MFEFSLALISSCLSRFNVGVYCDSFVFSCPSSFGRFQTAMTLGLLDKWFTPNFAAVDCLMIMTILNFNQLFVFRHLEQCSFE